jgi:hypothetical protein
MIPSNIGVKLEPNFMSPNPLAPNISELDTKMCKMKSPCLVTNVDFFNQISVTRNQRGSLYKIIVSIDPYGRHFGANKIFSIGKSVEADGFDIGLSNKSVTEMINEINSILAFLKRGNKDYLIRWGINIQNGEDYINNCAQAIEKSQTKYDMIKIINSKDINMVKIIRDKLGRSKQKIKINIDDSKSINTNDNDLFYDIESNKL